MRAAKRIPGEKYDPSFPHCQWGCGIHVGGSPYRTPIAGSPGGRYIVCGPDCAKRPEGVQVLTVNDWRSEK